MIRVLYLIGYKTRLIGILNFIWIWPHCLVSLQLSCISTNNPIFIKVIKLVTFHCSFFIVGLLFSSWQPGSRGHVCF
ncbi:hypothetical protein CN417_19195 [Bacillus thuringiensis]|nr:hypothetical protein CN417_19195 [Bacillus thuringiensis]